MKSDLEQDSKLLLTYSAQNNDTLPNSQSAAESSGLKTTSGNTMKYVSSVMATPTSSPATYCLQSTNGTNTYYTSSVVNTPTIGTCGPQDCPTGFIPVPGDARFGTSDFCISKYEMKNINCPGSQCTSSSMLGNLGGTPVSQPDGYLMVGFSQALAISTAPSACTGCHVPTEAEWMTVAANVIYVPSNWSGGAVGSGFIYSGNDANIGFPGGSNVMYNNALPASANDSDGYYGETNPAARLKRTLTLSNGAVIWDFAGNLWQWTQGTVAGGQQPGLSGENSYTNKEWNNSSLQWGGFPTLSRPSAISAQAATWGSAQGIGILSSNISETGLHGIMRGGSRNNGGSTGVLTVSLYSDTTSTTWSTLGLRVTR